MSEDVTVTKEKLADLVKTQLKDKKTELLKLNDEVYALTHYAMMRQVESGFIQQEIAAATEAVKEKGEKQSVLRKEIVQLEEQLKK